MLLEKILFTSMSSGIYNLNDKNLEVLELVDALRRIYDGLEFMFVNQHIQMQQLMVDPNSLLYQQIPLPSSDFNEELIEFKKRFSFQSLQ